MEEEINFPAELDDEDMELARKEWRLSGYYVEFKPLIPGAVSFTDIIYIRIDSNVWDFLVRYVRSETGKWISTP